MAVLKGTYEEPAYEVLAQQDNVELRAYQPMIVAAVTLPGSMSDTMNDAFRILAGYIFGNNISMAAPVLGQPETIAMTAPVVGTPGADSFTTQFVMPKSLTLASLPTPKDSRVKLITVDARRVVAARFSWFMSKSKRQAAEEKIQAFVKDKGLSIVGTPQVAFYDNPYGTLPWQRRNEVMVEVTSAIN